MNTNSPFGCVVELTFGYGVCSLRLMVIKLVINWPSWFRPLVHSSFRLSVPPMIPYSSVIFTGSTGDTVFKFFSWA